MEGIFPMIPLPSGFSKIGSQNAPPPPLRKFDCCCTPPGNITIPCGNQNKLFFSARCRILTLTVFSRGKSGGYCDQHITRRYIAYLKDAYHRICNMKIIDLIPSIPPHNFDKTAVTKKVHFQDRWERNGEKEMLHTTPVKQSKQHNFQCMFCIKFR